MNKVYSHANKTHFHKKSFAFNLVLKVSFLELENGLINCELSDVLLKCDHKRKRTMHTGTLFAENCFFPDSAYDCIIY